MTRSCKVRANAAGFTAIESPSMALVRAIPLHLQHLALEIVASATSGDSDCSATPKQTDCRTSLLSDRVRVRLRSQAFGATRIPAQLLCRTRFSGEIDIAPCWHMCYGSAASEYARE